MIEKIDLNMRLTSLNFEKVVKKIKPDLVILTSTREDMALERVTSGEIVIAELKAEMASISKVPVLIASNDHW